MKTLVVLAAVFLALAPPTEWPEAAQAPTGTRQTEAHEQLRADWSAADDRHRTLVVMSIQHHTREGDTDWVRALADYRNRATAVAMEPETMRQLELIQQRRRAAAINREIRQENGTARTVTTCRTRASGIYPTATTTCTTTEE